jgi:Skp family chaperone for outer membrane proteins
VFALSPPVFVSVPFRQDGSVDVSAQLAKMNKQIEVWQQRVDALKAKMAEPGYNRAPEAVRKAQSDKVELVAATLLTFVQCFLPSIVLRVLQLDAYQKELDAQIAARDQVTSLRK